MYHLSEMSVDCLSQDVLILDRERLALAESGWKGEQEAGIGYQRDLLSQKRLFFFIKLVYSPTPLWLGPLLVYLSSPLHQKASRPWCSDGV